MSVSRLFRGGTRWRRYPRPKAHMWPRMIEMRNPLVQNQSEMALVEGNEEVQAFPAQRPAETFAEGICLWRSDGRSQYPHALP